MNEMSLSKDLNVITAEINSYKQVAGQAIFEIGKRLKHVKENDLVHGEFGSWLEQIEIDRTQATRLMKISEQLSDGNYATSHNLGSNALYLIATLPPDQRDQTHTTSSGEEKKPDEMRVKELRELKKKLKDTEQELEAERNKEPEIIEVVPDDYDYIKGNFEAAQTMSHRYKEQLEEMRKELNESPKKDNLEMEELEKRKENLQKHIASSESIYALHEQAQDLLHTHSPIKYSSDFDLVRNDRELMSVVVKSVEALELWCADMREELPDKNIIEGEIVDE